MSEECCNFVNMEKDEVEHIAIVRCERQSEICPGNYCLRAFFNSTDYFELLKNKKKSLVGFLTCGGCPGKRIYRLVQRLRDQEHLDTLYFSTCIVENDFVLPKCIFQNKLGSDIEKLGIKVVKGTHASGMQCCSLY
ncbi:MAG: CGGC domain-containing protein [Methanosarcinales archaeon]